MELEDLARSDIVSETAALYFGTPLGSFIAQSSRWEGRHEVLSQLLIARFGEFPDLREQSIRFTCWDDPGAAVQAIVTATGLEELQRAEEPE